MIILTNKKAESVDKNKNFKNIYNSIYSNQNAVYLKNVFLMKRACNKPYKSILCNVKCNPVLDPSPL